MLKIFKNTSIYTFGRILPQAAGFILLPIYTNYLTPEDYGIVNSLQVFGAILLVFLTLSIDRSIFRLYFEFNNEYERKDYLGSITILLLIISTFFLILIFIFHNYIGLIFKSIDFYPYYVYIILSTYFSVFSLVPLIYFQVNEKASKFVVFSLFQFFLNTILILWFVVKIKLGASGMLQGIMYANIIMMPIYLYISYKTVNFTFRIKYVKDSLKFSIPLIPGIIGAWVLNLSDRIFIERYFNLYEVGIYSLGYKVAGLVLLFASAFNLAYNPIFYKLANSENQFEAKKIIIIYNSIFSQILMLCCFIVVIFSKEVITLLLNAKYASAYKIVPIIALSYLISQISNLFFLMIYQEKKTIQLMVISLIGAAFNILINFLFIPQYGAFGAAYATLLSFVLVFILTLLYAKKCYYIPYNWKLMFSVLSILVLLYFFFLIITFPLIITIVIKVFLVITLTVIFVLKYGIKLNQVALGK